MKRLVYITILLILSYLKLNAQDKYYLKIYQNTDINRKIEYTYSNNNDRFNEINLNRISAAFGFFSKKNWYHEFELSYSKSHSPIELEIRKANDYFTENNYFSFQYEIGKILNPEHTSIKYSLGAGINTYKSKTERDPFPTNKSFYFYDRYTGSTLNIIPRASWKFHEKLKLDLSMKIGLFDMREYTFYIENPEFSKKNQTSKELQFNFIPKAINIRVGVCYVLK